MSKPHTDRDASNRDAAASGISQLFAACDLDGSGFIEREELRAICNELSGEELSDVFRQLDRDGDGKISIAEFAEGFQTMRDTLVSLSSKDRQTLQQAAPGEHVARVSSRLDWKHNSKEWSSTDQELLLDGDQRKPERRKSLFDLVGSLDEGFTAITWCVVRLILYKYILHYYVMLPSDMIILIVIRLIRDSWNLNLS